MKFKLAFLSIIALLPMLAFAQSSITIFSEDGDKFFLVLNGQKQNTMPQTNVHIDGLSQPNYQAKILFEDASKNAISRNLPAQDPSTNAYADVTYKIKRTKDGELKIRYFSATPVQANYVPPADMYVMHYGQPTPTTTVTQTTVTTTSNNAGDGHVSIGFNGGEMNMNMNINDPNMQHTSVTQTTTTTTSETTGFDGPQQQGAARGCQYPMDWERFRSAKDAVAKATFEDTKLSTAKTILGSNCLSAEQVAQLCKLFGYEATRLEFAKTAYGKATDPGNYFKVNNVFDFDASKTELNNYIANGGR